MRIIFKVFILNRFKLPSFPFFKDTPISVIDADDTGPVAGDISPDGTEVLIKFKEEVYYWEWSVSNFLLAL